MSASRRAAGSTPMAVPSSQLDSSSPPQAPGSRMQPRVEWSAGTPTPTKRARTVGHRPYPIPDWLRDDEPAASPQNKGKSVVKPTAGSKRVRRPF